MCLEIAWRPTTPHQLVDMPSLAQTIYMMATTLRQQGATMAQEH